MRTYDREALALAYVESLDKTVAGNSLISGLQRLFDIDLDATSGPNAPLLALLRATAHSYLAITGPGDISRLDTEALITRLTEVGIAGDVLGDLDRIQETNEDSRAIHLHVLTTLITVLLGDKADLVVTDDDLRAVGVER